jgi:hypothetical protein
MQYESLKRLSNTLIDMMHCIRPNPRPKERTGFGTPPIEMCCLVSATRQGWKMSPGVASSGILAVSFPCQNVLFRQQFPLSLH